MALLQVNFVSSALFRTVTMNVILPVDKLPMPGRSEAPAKPFKTLYLLHGVLGNYTDWVSGTRIQRWAEEKDLCVVMPSGENRFYLDHEVGHAMYSQFIGRELVEMTRRMFPLSDKREDTFIAGLSMGGYGALENGLRFHDTFGYAAGLSAAFVTEGVELRDNETPIMLARRDFAEGCYGTDLENVHYDDRNPDVLVRRLKKEGVELPKIYLTCGTEDGLLPANEKFHETLDEIGVEHVWRTAPGAHEWDFWDREIRELLNWLPLGAEHTQGLNSGHVSD